MAAPWRLILALVLAACGADPRESGGLVRVDSEPEGEHCEAGGASILTGDDIDGDGYLDNEEVTSTQYVCNGLDEVQCSGGTVLTGTVTIASAADWLALDKVNCIDGDLLVAGLSEENLPVLQALEIVTGDVIIAANTKLRTLEALGRLRWVGGTYLVQGNDSLGDLVGMGGLDRVFAINIIGNTRLPNLHGLEAFVNLHTTLAITNNVALEDLSGLHNLVTSNRALTIRSNPRLANLTALAGLRAVSALEISGNGGLPTIDLPQLDKVDFRLLINTNAVLTSVSLPMLTTLGGFAQLDGNGALVTIDAPQLVTSGGLLVTNDTSLVSVTMPKLTFMTGDVDFTLVPQLATLDFSQLVSIGGRLVVKSAPELHSFTGFGNLLTIGGQLFVASCNQLASFAGLGALTQVSGDMTVTGNAQLASFAGLEAFTIVGEDLTISANPMLPPATATAFAAGITVYGSTTIAP
ncbi:MAG: hypothetical protein H0T79_10980 [Deltaproteobacteria bacterium]|nr:hypothetical protein [Deltaproteobacteria bacterium]